VYHTKCSIALNAAKVQNIQWQTQLFENRDRLLSLEASGVQKQSHLWELTTQYNTIQYKICKAPCCRGFRDEAVANRRLGLKPAVKQFCYLIVNVTSNSSRFSHTHLTVPFLGLCRWAGTRKVKPIWIYWSMRQWVAVASAGRHASLHLAPDRQPRHHSVFYRSDALPVAQTIASKHWRQIHVSKYSTFCPGYLTGLQTWDQLPTLPSCSICIEHMKPMYRYDSTTQQQSTGNKIL